MRGRAWDPSEKCRDVYDIPGGLLITVSTEATVYIYIYIYCIIF